MQLIPALDIKDGCIVHAAGERQAYRPLRTPYFPSPDPADVVRRLSERFRCATFYIADLNAVAADGNNEEQISEVTREFPDFEFWLDSGVGNRADFERVRSTQPSCVPIVATETLTDAELPAALCAEQKRFILSLDFGPDGLLGADELLERATDWPGTVIALSLPRVGTGAGPDLETVAAVRKRRAGQRIVAGGGVRNQDDLLRLARAGADAALVANAVYTGGIKPPLRGCAARFSVFADDGQTRNDAPAG